MNPLDVLSIDVDAEIRKLPANTFPTHEEYVVELVRSALDRGATEVRVFLGRTRVEMIDNGRPIPAATLADLRDVFDSDLPADRRQSALAPFLGPDGIGLLAAWAPSPKHVRIESAEGRLDGDTALGTWSPPGGGTEREGQPKPNRIEIRRKGKRGLEAELLRELVRFAPATVLLGDKELVSRGADRTALVSGSVSGPHRGRIWIPMSGDVCRINLLDNGVRRKLLARPVFPDGVVYHAAIECRGKVPENLARGLREDALELYRQVARGYGHASPAARERIEELLLQWCSARGSTELVEHVEMFRCVGPRLLALAEVRALAAEDRLYAVDAGDRRWRSSPAARELGTWFLPGLPRAESRGGEAGWEGGTVLALSARQREFLSGTVGLVLQPPPMRVRWKRLKSAWSRLKLALCGATSRLAPWRRFIAPEALSEGETLLAKLVGQMLDTGRCSFADNPPGVERRSGGEEADQSPARSAGRAGRAMDVRFVSNRLGVPAFAVRSGDGPAVLALRRKHPVVVAAAAAVLADPANVHLAVAALGAGLGDRS